MPKERTHEVITSHGKTNCLCDPAGRRRKPPIEMAGGGPLAGYTQAVGGLATTRLRPVRRRGTCPVVQGHLLGELCAGLSVGAVRASLVVSNKSRQGSLGPLAPHSGSGPCPTAVRPSADLGVAAARGLVGESQPRRSFVSFRWITTPPAGPSTEAPGLASWASPDPDRSDRTLAHGCRP